MTRLCSVQALKVLHPVVRKNASDVCIFRLRSAAELESVCEEYGAVFGAGRKGRETVRAIYDEATARPYDFLWINARAKNHAEIFHRNFEEVLRAENGGEDNEENAAARSNGPKSGGRVGQKHQAAPIGR